MFDRFSRTIEIMGYYSLPMAPMVTNSRSTPPPLKHHRVEKGVKVMLLIVTPRPPHPPPPIIQRQGGATDELHFSLEIKASHTEFTESAWQNGLCWWCARAGAKQEARAVPGMFTVTVCGKAVSLRSFSSCGKDAAEPHQKVSYGKR